MTNSHTDVSDEQSAIAHATHYTPSITCHSLHATHYRYGASRSFYCWTLFDRIDPSSPRVDPSRHFFKLPTAGGLFDTLLTQPSQRVKQPHLLTHKDQPPLPSFKHHEQHDDHRCEEICRSRSDFVLHECPRCAVRRSPLSAAPD